MKKKMKPFRYILNLGCGQEKIDGTVNIDVEKSCKPDMIVNFAWEKLPFRTGTIDEVFLFHTIEHIPKKRHAWILLEIQRVLKVGGKFYCSFPEFLKCVENWKKNLGGQRQFWENTIFGRQLYLSDHHICIMDSLEFKQKLLDHGFSDISFQPEPKQPFNTMFYALKPKNPVITYEQIIAEDQALVKVIKPNDKVRTQNKRKK